MQELAAPATRRFCKPIGIDSFKLVCALLVVGVHTAPLGAISERLDFLVFNVFCRIAVPFFFMVTGYFLLPKYVFAASGKMELPIGFMKKTAIIYAVATLIYFPVNLYAGSYTAIDIATVLKRIIFDGTFYHLWYLPASIIGVLLVCLMMRFFSIRITLCITFVLYLFGLIGNSYYHIAKDIPILNAVYSAVFQVSTFTRNGIFFAPIFLAMGAWLSRTKRPLGFWANVVGFAISMCVMLAEGMILFDIGKHQNNSMYVFLLPCMYFLFGALTCRKGERHPACRDISTLIYILHPLFIIAVRFIGKMTDSVSLLVGNGLIHYVFVCILSVLFSIVFVKKYRNDPFRREV